ncbi:MAG: glycosyltransferase [Methanosarcinales archaeon]|nr:glycosyltransferase [Methanosarcinales archaeon]
MTPTPLLILTLIITAIPLSVYLIYILAAITSKPIPPKPLQQLPNISIVIPAYNEESVISDRINNLAEIYPKDKMELIISNDGSSDNTETIAQNALKNNSLSGKVITHSRSGVNKAINRGINETSSEIVVITGSDGLFDKDTIPDLVSTLLSSDDIGAVSGDLIPVAKGDTVFSKSEAAYRSIYGRICTWESNIHSTYCFNGPVVAFKKIASSTLNTRRGADDASMALSVIRKGYKCKYVPTAKFYEYVPDKFYEQRRQKIRRATRLLEATFFNLDVLSAKNGKFGTFIFPLRILMFFVVPTAFLLSLVLWTIVLASINILYSIGFVALIFAIVMVGNIYTNVLSSFIIYQVYLFLGLFNMLRDVHVWEPTERVKI